MAAAVDHYPSQIDHHVFIKQSRFGDVSSTHANNRNPDPRVVAKRLINDALTQRVSRIDTEHCDAGDEDTFFVADLGEVYRQHMRWKMNLPRVKPFYGEFFFRSIAKQ